MQFESIAVGNGRLKEERNVLAVDREVEVERAATVIKIGESSIVDQPVNRGRDRVAILRDYENGPIGRDYFWRENGRKTNLLESNCGQNLQG